MSRIVIYTKDVMLLTDKTERQSRYLFDKIKLHYKKEKHQYLTIQEFCNYTGLNYEEVMKKIK